MLLERVAVGNDGQPQLLSGELQQTLLEQVRKAFCMPSSLERIKTNSVLRVQADLHFESVGNIWPGTDSFSKSNVSREIISCLGDHQL